MRALALSMTLTLILCGRESAGNETLTKDEPDCAHSLFVDALNNAWDMLRILKELDSGNPRGAKEMADSTTSADESTLAVLNAGMEPKPACAQVLIEDTKRHQSEIHAIILSVDRAESDEARKIANSSLSASSHIIETYPDYAMTGHERNLAKRLEKLIDAEKAKAGNNEAR